MKISAATGIYEQRGDSRIHRDLKDAIIGLHEAGYDTFDLSLASLEQPGFILRGDDWERKVDELGQTAAELGVTFYQSHLPYVPKNGMSVSEPFRQSGYREQFFEFTRRAYHASRTLGVKWTVLHPLTFPEHNYENKASLEANHALYDEYIELGVRLGVGTAIENLPPSADRVLSMVYCQHYDQLIELVDSFAEPMVGVCWDTGHANLMRLDQGRALRALGSRVKVLHIHDNHSDGGRDEHVLPYIGDVDWDSVLQALVDIDYGGTLNYESGKTSANAYGSLQMDFVKLSYQNGLFLRDKYERYKRMKSERTL